MRTKRTKNWFHNVSNHWKNSMIFQVDFFKFHDFSRSGRSFFHFPGFHDFSRGWEPCNYDLLLQWLERKWPLTLLTNAIWPGLSLLLSLFFSAIYLKSTKHYRIYRTSWAPRKHSKMKTPERWRALPQRALLVSILAQKWSKDVKTSRRGVTSHDVRCHYKMALCNLHRSHHRRSPKITFFKMATLTFDLRTPLRYYKGQSPHRILGP